MILLILGLLVFAGSHLFLAVSRREIPGTGRMFLGLVSLVGIWLMYVGYGRTDGPVFWGRNPALVGINNLLMVFAFYLCAAHGMKTAITRKIRRPLLVAVKVWALAHILVNGDLPSFVLFGGLIIWAVLQAKAANGMEGAWVKNKPRETKFEWMALAGAVIVTLVVMLVHNAFGYQPWG